MAGFEAAAIVATEGNTDLDIAGPVLITGGTSGVGLDMARAFARLGSDVGVGCRNEKVGLTVIDELLQINPGGNFAMFVGDISLPNQLENVVEGAVEWNGGRPLGHLVLAASGGLDTPSDRDPETYPTEINVDAQTGMVRLATQAGLLNEWSTTSFLISHQAIYIGQTVEVGDQKFPIGDWSMFGDTYEPVAESKFEGLIQLLNMVRSGEMPSRMQVSSTDLIPDSKVAIWGGIAMRLMPDKHFGSKQERRLEAGRRFGEIRSTEQHERGLNGKLYTSAEFASATTMKAIRDDWEVLSLTLLPDHNDEAEDLATVIADDARRLWVPRGYSAGSLNTETTET